MFNHAAWAMCHSKHRYPGHRAAGIAAMRAEERTGKAHRIYRCPYCEMWHLTSAPRREPAEDSLLAAPTPAGSR